MSRPDTYNVSLTDEEKREVVRRLFDSIVVREAGIIFAKVMKDEKTKQHAQGGDQRASVVEAAGSLQEVSGGDGGSASLQPSVDPAGEDCIPASGEASGDQAVAGSKEVP